MVAMFKSSVHTYVYCISTMYRDYKLKNPDSKTHEV